MFFPGAADGSCGAGKAEEPPADPPEGSLARQPSSAWFSCISGPSAAELLLLQEETFHLGSRWFPFCKAAFTASPPRNIVRDGQSDGWQPLVASDPRLKGCPFGGSSMGGRRSRPGGFACSVWAMLIFPVMLNICLALPERNQSWILSFLIAIYPPGERNDKGFRAG